MASFFSFVEYCFKFLISFCLGFLDVEGKVFPWCRKRFFLSVEDKNSPCHKGKVFFIEEVIGIPCLTRNKIETL